MAPKVFMRVQFILSLPGSTYTRIFPNKPSQPFISTGFTSSHSIDYESETAFPHSQPRIPKGTSKILFSILHGSTPQRRRSDCLVKVIHRLSTAQGVGALPPPHRSRINYINKLYPNFRKGRLVSTLLDSGCIFHTVI